MLNLFSRKSNASPVQQFILPFDGSPHFHVSNQSSYCGVEIRRDSKAVTVKITEPEMTYGLSVTNAIEAIATRVYQLCLSELNPRKIRWFQHDLCSIGGEEVIREVNMKWSKEHKRYVHPEWEKRTILNDFQIYGVKIEDDHFSFTLKDGKEVKLPFSRYPILGNATPKSRIMHDIEFSGTVIHWYELGFRLPVRDAIRSFESEESESEIVVPLSMLRPPLSITA